MTDILSITGPIYAIMLLGYACTRGGLFARQEMRVMGKFVINLCIPALVFNALAQRRIHEILDASYLLAYCAGSMAVVLCAWLWARRVLHRPATPSALMAMGMACANSGFVGYPILLLTLAPVAGVSLALNMVVENLLVIPLLLALAERGRSGGQGLKVVAQSLRKLATNPMILGLAAGLVASLLEMPPGGPVVRTVQMLAAASGAVSLFVIGGTLVGLSPGGMGTRVWSVVAGKLLLHPLLVLGAVSVLPLLGMAPISADLRHAAVLMAAMPMMSIYPILAQNYGEEDDAAAAMLLATVCSFFTLNLLLWLLPRMG
jgi:malonate transporter